MTMWPIAAGETWRSEAGGASIAPGPARMLVLLVAAGALAAGVLTTGADHGARTAANADGGLVVLLRAMAAIKAIMAAAATAAVIWRLGVAIAAPRLAAYALACAAMAAGPGLVWGLARVGAGAVLLHGGLLATIVLLWRDPAVGRRLAASLAARRARPPVTARPCR